MGGGGGGGGGGQEEVIRRRMEASWWKGRSAFGTWRRATKAAVGRDPPPIKQTHLAHVGSTSAPFKPAVAYIDPL